MSSASSNSDRDRRWLALAALSACCSPALAQDQPARQESLTVEERLTRAEQALADSKGLRSGYDDGFFWETADRSQRFTFGGLFQYHADLFEGGLDGRDTQFDLRRMRLEFGGEFYQRYRFNLEPDFDGDGVELEEAWVGATFAREGPLLILGRMKEPFGLEEMTSRRWQDFVNFSLLNQFSPAEDHGVTLLQRGAERSVEYGAALYNGTGGDDLNDDKDVAGRIVVRPWIGTSSRAARLQFGAALTYGDAEADIAGEELDTEAKVPFLAFEPGSRLDGRRARAGMEVAWLRGPFAMQAEALQVRQEMEGAGGGEDIRVEGWYAQASWVLTGEDRTWHGIDPARPMLSHQASERGSGAVQLAARVSQLDLDDRLVSAGLVAASSFPDSVASYDLGANWYLNRHAVVKLHWLRTLYDEDIVVGGDTLGSEDALLMQFQLQW
jgi:phosphate-selective porin OprO and OprP